MRHTIACLMLLFPVACSPMPATPPPTQPDPIEILNDALFDVTYDEMVIVRDVEFYSLCEQHMLPFFGRAHVAYLPSKAVVGISKLARVVDAYARRLQIQERMTADVAQCIETGLSPLGVGVVIDAEHGCMTLRGVNKRAPRLRTQTFKGVLADDPALQQRFLDAIPTSW